MGNKPDKFGITFWLAADVQTKYMLNGAPYLGKEETRSRGQLVGESVVLRLAEPFLGKGRNMTTDNFFTSLKLATALQAKKTSLVGTVGKRNVSCPLPRKNKQSCSARSAHHLPGKAVEECVYFELCAHKRGHHRWAEGKARVGDIL